LFATLLIAKRLATTHTYLPIDPLHQKQHVNSEKQRMNEQSCMLAMSAVEEIDAMQKHDACTRSSRARWFVVRQLDAMLIFICTSFNSIRHFGVVIMHVPRSIFYEISR